MTQSRANTSDEPTPPIAPFTPATEKLAERRDDDENEPTPYAEARRPSSVEAVDARQSAFAQLAPIIERARWKFAQTYARTYPHEYTTKSRCDAANHALPLDCIERYGRVERFFKQKRKYLYFGDRKFWHMGDPYSEDPEQWPNVINRTWVDVRRYAENVRHLWTPEEVELQMRLWEIRLEQATGQPPHTAMGPDSSPIAPGRCPSCCTKGRC